MNNEYHLTQLIEPLLAWYPSHARELPWRSDPTPYHVWVSEIMLQQTRVEAVKRYYARFLETLPDIQALAECEEDTLLKLWEGLGYYNRVRNMQLAARQVMRDYSGELPADYDTLLTLKGIGQYTAAAITSIAYNKPAAAVDGNVLRILMRALECDLDIARQSTKHTVQQWLQPIVPKDRPGMFTQAMMELGATVCVPNAQPLCDRCPWEMLCQAKLHGSIDSYPVKSKAKARRIEKKTILLIREGNRVLIRKRAATGLLAGMYEYANLEGHVSQKTVLEAVKEKGLSPIRIKAVGEAKHIFTHVEWRMKGYVIYVEDVGECDEQLFVDLGELREKYAIPSAYGFYTRYLEHVLES